MGGLLSDINRESKEWELQHAMEELKRLVTNWKGHTIDSFGRLLLFDDLTIFPEKSHLTGRVSVIPKSLKLSPIGLMFAVSRLPL